MKVMDIAHLNRHAGMYALFGADGCLYLMQAGGSPLPAAHLPGISTEEQIKLYVHEPWVCVTERFGTHAALVNIENGSVRDMSREDYHAKFSSYSIGFLERNGRLLLICQTEWNRLNIMDAETGECLTDREVYHRESEPGSDSDGGRWIGNKYYEEKNYIDYFHSLLHVSPDGECFLSNGWIWHPIGQIICFRTDDFFERYELSNVSTDYISAYNWDYPCAFIGNDRFVVAVDDMRKSGLYGAKHLKDYVYKQLQFYRLNMPVAENEHGERTLTIERDAFCSAFTPDKYDRIRGELVWDAAYGLLVAITPNSAFAVSLDGEIQESLPESMCSEDNINNNPGLQQSRDAGWHYNPKDHLLYHWSQEAGEIEELRFGIMHDGTGKPAG